MRNLHKNLQALQTLQTLQAVRTVKQLLSTLTLVVLGSGVCGVAARAQEAALKNAPHIDLVEMNRVAVAKSLPLLQTSGSAFTEHMGGACFSCHHQSLPSMAFAVARQHGFTYDTKRKQAETQVVYGMLDHMKPALTKALTNPATEKEVDLVTVDPAISMGYALAGLAAEECKPDGATEAAVRYLMRKQAADGRWPVLTARPPLESSEFTATALAVRAMQTYAPTSASPEVARRTAQSRAWLLGARPKTTEDKAFRLCGLRWTAADAKDIKAAIADLIALQQDDGGWGQTLNAPSDAYATGQALVALHQAGGLPVTDSVYTRGAFFLFATQQEDGSWLVSKRANPVQTYFESKFPHEKSQFISIAGTSWATMALALTVPVSGKTSALTTAAR